VLRLVPGRSARVGLVDGPFGQAHVLAIDEGTVTLACEFETATPPRPAVDVLLALPRPKVMRRLWAQLAALGVGRIMLTNAERVERHYFDAHILAPEHYRPLLLEGLQQAKDTRVPEVSIHKQLKILIEDDLDRLYRTRRACWPIPAPRQRSRPRSRPQNASRAHCWRSAPRAAGTTLNAACSADTDFSPSRWDRGRCGPTRRASRSSRACTRAWPRRGLFRSKHLDGHRVEPTRVALGLDAPNN
jgi:hypothetical protein